MQSIGGQRHNLRLDAYLGRPTTLAPNLQEIILTRGLKGLHRHLTSFQRWHLLISRTHATCWLFAHHLAFRCWAIFRCATLPFAIGLLANSLARLLARTMQLAMRLAASCGAYWATEIGASALWTLDAAMGLIALERTLAQVRCAGTTRFADRRLAFRHADLVALRRIAFPGTLWGAATTRGAHRITKCRAAAGSHVGGGAAITNDMGGRVCTTITITTSTARSVSGQERGNDLVLKRRSESNKRRRGFAMIDIEGVRVLKRRSESHKRRRGFAMSDIEGIIDTCRLPWAKATIYHTRLS